MLFQSIVVYLKLGSRLTFLLTFDSISLLFGLRYVISLQFLLKYRCIPKTGFSADISLDIFTGISIFYWHFTGISIDINVIDIFIDVKEQVRRRSGLLLKLEQPNLEGEE